MTSHLGEWESLGLLAQIGGGVILVVSQTLVSPPSELGLYQIYLASFRLQFEIENLHLHLLY